MAATDTRLATEVANPEPNLKMPELDFDFNAKKAMNIHLAEAMMPTPDLSLFDFVQSLEMLVTAKDILEFEADDNLTFA